MSTDPFSRLNPAQQSAVDHGIDAADKAAARGPLLVIAGAGTGKTNTLAHRVARLLLAGVDANRILLLTFSRRAAAEMTRRAERIAKTAMGARHAQLSWSGTFHAIGARLLRRYAPAIGLVPAFTIIDREDAADLMNLVRHDLELSQLDSRFPLKGTCLAIYSRAVNTHSPLETVLAASFPWCAQWETELRNLFAAYVRAKQAQNVLDYDDLLLYWAEMMAVDALAAEVAAEFDHVLVDEYQDTNRLQAAILLRLKPDGDGLTVVGDDAQSIYSFRAATVRNILDFPHAFQPAARVVTLEENYRSSQAILEACNAVIGLTTERFSKNLRSRRPPGRKPQLVTVRDEADQVRYAVERILANREAGMRLATQAVLFRAAHHSAALEIELNRRNIPFVKYGGLKFLEAAHVKDVLGVLRFAENPKDRIAGFRVLQLLPGMGPGFARKCLDQLETAGRAREIRGAFRPPPAAAESWPMFADLMVHLMERREAWPAELGLVRCWYEPHLERLHADAAIRSVDLAALETIAGSYASRQAFLTELTLDPASTASDWAGAPLLDEDYLILSTIHSAKGQEWTAVYILNVVDGAIPSDMATGTPDEVEEERRLLYVAMTRAKDELHLIVPQRFYVHRQARLGDRHVYGARSRFVPAAILKHFECTGWPPPSAPRAATAAAEGRHRVDLATKLREFWR
jgi:DNA helicase II / ATP-dependent DNA helicase PcrA